VAFESVGQDRAESPHSCPNNNKHLLTLMNCPACGHENPDGAKFCNYCARTLALRCLKCGTPNPAGAKFCNECATPLTTGNESLPEKTNEQIHADIHIKSEQIDSSSAPEGERKTVTALFADIKGSMELMEDLDPEEARAIVDPALKLMIDAVSRLFSPSRVSMRLRRASRCIVFSGAFRLHKPARMRQFSAAVARTSQRPDWLLERGRFEPPSPVIPCSCRDLVSVRILRRDFCIAYPFLDWLLARVTQRSEQLDRLLGNRLAGLGLRHRGLEIVPKIRLASVWRSALAI
jgi:hypothetical protein